MQKLKRILRLGFILCTYFSFAIVFGTIFGSFLANNSFIEVNYTKVNFNEVEYKDLKFINNKNYIINGVNGFNVNFNKVFKLNEFKLNLESWQSVIPAINKVTFKGSLAIEELETLIKNKFSLLIKDNVEDKFTNLVAQKIALKETNDFYVDKNLISVGKLEVFMQNCNFFNDLEIAYDVIKKDYLFTSTESFFSNLCNKYAQPMQDIAMECSKCEFYPVDKLHPLSADYNVEVINADAIPGGKQLKPEAYSALLELYRDAQASGFNITLTSAYRSFEDQKNVYEGWVQYEMSFGKSREQAEKDANSYSALPGESEHQLGTTADIVSTSCLAFDNYCQPNVDLWNWLDSNAHKYGFAKSYPKGFEAQTAYVNEQWHYRFIGKDLASEFYSRYNGISYLAEFLRNKNLYK